MEMHKDDIEQWGPIESRVLYMSFWFPAIARSAKTPWRAKWPHLRGFLENDRVTFYWNKAEGQKLGARAIEHVILNNAARTSLWKAYTKNIRETREWVKRSIGDPRQPKNYASIRRLATKLYNRIVRSWDLGIIPEIANYGAPAYLEEKLSPYVPRSSMHEALEALLAPEHLSFHQESERALLEATLCGDDTALFEKYSREHFFVENSYYASTVITVQSGKRRAQDLAKAEAVARLHAIENHSTDVCERKATIQKKYGVPQRIMTTAERLSHSIWWQDHRKGFAWWLDGVVDVFSRAAEKELRIPFDDIMYYTSEEWMRLFEETPVLDNTEIIARRKKFVGYEIVPNKGTFSLLYGKAGRELKRQLYIPTTAKTHTIKGTPVSCGKARGKVKVLLMSRLSNEMELGSILVAPMTSPDYIAAMRKAAAIVTDIGGLMSHAAIVSRELGKPCVVGTKIATKVLKDGDMVEVNADTGTVTILSSA